MRTIKFRAWDNIEMKELKGIDLPLKTRGEFLSDGRELIVMQFTNYLDKNGKEIYEGDIVKHRQGKTDEYETYPIDSLEWFFFNQGNSEFPYSWESEHFEVIGNIYQNPELLK